MRAPMPTEEQDQIALIEWFDQWAPKPLRERLAAVPNGGYRMAKTAGRLKAQGVRPGFPDLLLLTPRGGYAGLIIELKRVRGGVVSPQQADWHTWLRAQGFFVQVCAGFEAAKDALQQYLALKS